MTPSRRLESIVEQEHVVCLANQLSRIALKKASNPPEYAFVVGQTVRVKKTLTCDTHAVEDMLGCKGIVVKRYQTMLHNEFWYHVKIGKRVEPFREDELDYRFIRL